ncbi:MAG: carbohydrate ABC transporter permease [Lachnospiraceae bacterium]|nr:carbohydrate ABC transporter permease [Lachnospiraceae bacterium]MBR4058951.1 carbohydrate ABC transporter permease [Lachnospiraceae bacterium]
MAKAKKVKRSGADQRLEICLIIIMSIIGVIMLYPLLIVVSTSFSSASAVISGKVWLFPVDFSLEGYKAVFRTNDVLIGYRNSLFYMVVGTVINLFMTLITAYPLSRDDLVGQGIIMKLFTFTMIFGGGMIPNYLLMKDLGLLNTVWVMLIPGAISVYNMIITRTFIKSNIPKEMLEAAQIDGCSDIQYFIKMVLPLSGAVIAVITLYYAIGHWNAYFSAFMYLNDKELYPLQIFLKNILVSNQVEADMIVDEQVQSVEGIAEVLKYSLIVVAVVPVMIIYPFVQKHFVKGVMIGAVKG